LHSGCHGSNPEPSEGVEDGGGEKKLPIVNVRKGSELQECSTLITDLELESGGGLVIQQIIMI